MRANLPIEMLPQLEDPKACLERAMKCEQMAKRRPKQHRRMLLELAERWREMAQELDTQFGAREKQPEQPNPSA